jgi:hypothetical protein
MTKNKRRLISAWDREEVEVNVDATRPTRPWGEELARIEHMVPTLHVPAFLPAEQIFKAMSACR